MAKQDTDEPEEWLGRVIDMAELGRRLVARKAELGWTDDAEMVRKMRNAGNNRTPSKRALLKAIEDAGGKW